MTSCRTERETVSQMEKAGPFGCCRHSLSARVRAHSGHFEHIVNFCICGFKRLTFFCFVAKV